MTQIGKFKYFYLAYLSRPAIDRPLYRAIRRRRIRSILELGIGDSRRAQRMLELAAGDCPEQPLAYTGVDLFESRPAGEPQVSLKEAYTTLRRLNARVQLMPGDPFCAGPDRQHAQGRGSGGRQRRPGPRRDGESLALHPADDSRQHAGVCRTSRSRPPRRAAGPDDPPGSGPTGRRRGLPRRRAA